MISSLISYFNNNQINEFQSNLNYDVINQILNYIFSVDYSDDIKVNNKIMEHKMKLSEPYYTQVKSKRKTIEARIYDEKRQSLNIGDTIIFTDNDGNKPFKRKIVDLKVFLNFEKAIKSAKLKNILPHIKTYNEGVELYHSIIIVLEMVSIRKKRKYME